MVRRPPTPTPSAIQVTPVNDAPVNTVPGPQTVNEDTALAFTSGNGNAISVDDVDGNLASTQLSVLHGTLAVAAGGAGISGNNSATLTLSGTEAQINATLATLSYQGGLNFNGSDTLTVKSTDGAAATDTDTVAIQVTPVNDAPVNTVPGPQTVNEDTALAFTSGNGNAIRSTMWTAIWPRRSCRCCTARWRWRRAAPASRATTAPR